MEPTFKTISETLDAALKDVADKKVYLDKANADASKASNEYNDAVSKAQSLRSQMTELLSSVLPTYNDNVRVMGGVR